MVSSSVGSQAGDQRSATLRTSASAYAGLSLVDMRALASVLLDRTSSWYIDSVTGSFTGLPLLVNDVEKMCSNSSKHGGVCSKSKSRKNCAVVSAPPNARQMQDKESKGRANVKKRVQHTNKAAIACKLLLCTESTHSL
jgi:hypothetical protein